MSNLKKKTKHRLPFLVVVKYLESVMVAEEKKREYSRQAKCRMVGMFSKGGEEI